MKKLLLALSLIALLAGCASHDNGMGGTSDQDNTLTNSNLSHENMGK